MGLFDKIKSALFEEEEIEIESPEEEKPPVKETNVEKYEAKTENLNNDRELFKVDNTFDFPEFDEKEFASSYEPPKAPKVKKEEKEVLHHSTPKEDVYEYEKKVKIRRENPGRNERIVKTTEVTKKAFRPSPVISPVYGILDKNYTKDDIITVEKTVKVKSNIDVDMVRKKAFGTLEEDLEKTINEKVEDFYNDDTKSIDELLNDSIDDTIEISYDKEEERDREDISKSIEDELERVEEIELPQRKEIKPEKSKEELENDTLENDLFDLIDSMYDTKED